MTITVLGAGAWGTALAKVLHERDHRVTLWGYNAAHLENLRRSRHNERYLPGIALPEFASCEPDLDRAAADAEMIVMAVPSKAFREVATSLAAYQGIIVSVTKGIEFKTGLTMCGVLEECAPRARVAALSGPTLALEVGRGIPTAIVAASNHKEAALEVQNAFHQPRFRVYSSPDIKGVELGGALKNVVAIAAGVGDGLGFGDNSKAALLTRAIVEIQRVGVARGARPETFSGLSGLGDLTVTCFSKLSRNRSFGEQLGRGSQVRELLSRSISIVEGYPTAKSARQLSSQLGVDTPIIDEVHAVLYEGKNPGQAVADLTRRETKAENDTGLLPRSS